jgi:hypothetical protein
MGLTEVQCVYVLDYQRKFTYVKVIQILDSLDRNYGR